jgi:DNA (cytosine-5)-methyltransferase 1
VPAFTHKGSGGLRMLLDSFRDINQRRRVKYDPQWAIVDCARHGVPQHRNRFFLVAERAGARFQFPNATFGDAVLPFRTAWDALCDVGVEIQEAESLDVGGRWGELLPSIPEGKNYLWHTANGGGLSLFGWRRRYWTFLLKLAKSLPAWTLQANPGPSAGPFHWENRRLSIREMARLQTLPDDLEIQGSQYERRKQVGNAVPSLMAEVLGREMRRQLFGDPVESPIVLVSRCHTPIPRPGKPSTVPERFLSLVGDHPPHPGKGLGPGASQRRLARRRA